MATRVPLPSTSILLPNPLATGITPFAAINRRWGHQKRMLIAIGRDAFTNDVQTIVYAFGDRQNFEIAGR